MFQQSTADLLSEHFLGPLLTMAEGMQILSWNPAAERVFGYSEKEAVGGAYMDLLVPPDRLEESRKWFKIALETGSATYDSQARTRDGNLVDVEIAFKVLPGNATDPKIVAANVRDITARKQAEPAAASAAELARSNKELELFASVASHDLQEPLRMVTGYAQLLRSRYEGKLDKDADDFFNFMVGGALRMKALIEGLLAYSRVGSAGQQLSPVDCNVAVLEAVQNLSKIIEETQAEISCGELPTVWADRMQIVQLFQNLLANAVKFRGSKKPDLQISAERQDNEWVFSVSDNGIGIEHEQRERIFGVFQRLHSVEEYPGTGIGLAICQRIVQRHHGRIWVESEYGQGSTFRFTFPSVRESQV